MVDTNATVVVVVAVADTKVTVVVLVAGTSD